MHKKKEIIQDVTLHDLDVANARPQVLPPGSCWAAGRRPCQHGSFCALGAPG